MTILMLLGLFMMLIVLIQRGRGGGLAGAFGGAGGSSAFGTKAGDVFTKITIVVAVLWFSLAGISGMVLRAKDSANQRGFQGKNAEEDDANDKDGKAGSVVPKQDAANDGAAGIDFSKLPKSGLPAEVPSDPVPGDAAVPGTPEPGQPEDAGAAEAGAPEDPAANGEQAGAVGETPGEKQQAEAKEDAGN